MIYQSIGELAYQTLYIDPTSGRLVEELEDSGDVGLAEVDLQQLQGAREFDFRELLIEVWIEARLLQLTRLYMLALEVELELLAGGMKVIGDHTLELDTLFLRLRIVEY